MPLPLVTAAFALILSFLFPRYIGGVIASIVGLLFGFIVVYIGKFVSHREARRVETGHSICPNCHARLGIQLTAGQKRAIPKNWLIAEPGYRKIRVEEEHRSE